MVLITQIIMSPTLTVLIMTVTRISKSDSKIDPSSQSVSNTRASKTRAYSSMNYSLSRRVSLDDNRIQLSTVPRKVCHACLFKSIYVFLKIFVSIFLLVHIRIETFLYILMLFHLCI